MNKIFHGFSPVCHEAGLFMKGEYMASKKEKMLKEASKHWRSVLFEDTEKDIKRQKAIERMFMQPLYIRVVERLSEYRKTLTCEDKRIVDNCIRIVNEEADRGM